MLIRDKINNYLRKLEQEKKIRPGEKLPSYSEICQLFNITYTSAQRAFKQLEQEGRINVVKGVGSFLNGGKVLDVDIYLTRTTFDFKEMQKIFEHISDKNDLNLKITLKDIKSLKKDNYGSCPDEHKVIISEVDPWFQTTGSLMDYSAFEDYSNVIEKLKLYDMEYNNFQLPFYFFTYQGAVNTKVLKEAGFKKKIESFSTLEWWDELVVACKNKMQIPAVKHFETGELWLFPLFMISVLMMLQKRKSLKTLFKTPFFDTLIGKRLFEITDNFQTLTENDKGYHPLMGAINLDIGSWISVQYKKQFNISDDDFYIVPLKCGANKIMHYSLVPLQTFVSSKITENEKDRVWCLLKNLLSKSIQKKIVAQTGAISVRKDMTIQDHKWVCRDDFKAFFPSKGDIFVSNSIIPNEKIAVLGALYEQYEFYGANGDTIRKCMDQKLAAV